jgi:hypothetical protein
LHSKPLIARFFDHSSDNSDASSQEAVWEDLRFLVAGASYEMAIHVNMYQKIEIGLMIRQPLLFAAREISTIGRFDNCKYGPQN